MRTAKEIRDRLDAFKWVNHASVAELEEAIELLKWILSGQKEKTPAPPKEKNAKVYGESPVKSALKKQGVTQLSAKDQKKLEDGKQAKKQKKVKESKKKSEEALKKAIKKLGSEATVKNIGYETGMIRKTINEAADRLKLRREFTTSPRGPKSVVFTLDTLGSDISSESGGKGQSPHEDISPAGFDPASSDLLNTVIENHKYNPGKFWRAVKIAIKQDGFAIHNNTGIPLHKWGGILRDMTAHYAELVNHNLDIDIEDKRLEPL